MSTVRLWSRRWRSRVGRLVGAVGILVALMLSLAACGGGSSGKTSTGGTTSVASFCPNGKTSQDVASPALILTTSTPGDTATAHVGETIVVELPSTNMRWALTSVSPTNVLTSKQPSDALDAALQRCLWTFTAAQAGTAHLTYIGTPQCNPTQACPQASPQTFYPPSPATSTSAQGTPSVALTPSHAIRIIFTISIS